MDRQCSTQSESHELGGAYLVSIHANPLTRFSSDVMLEVALRKPEYPEEKLVRKLNKENVIQHCGDKHRTFRVDEKGGPVRVELTSLANNWSIAPTEQIQNISHDDIQSSKYVIKTFCLRKQDSPDSDDISVTFIVSQGIEHDPRNLQLHAKVYMKPMNVCPHCNKNLDQANGPGPFSSISSDDSDVTTPVIDDDDKTPTTPVEVSGGRKFNIDSGCYDDDYDDIPIEQGKLELVDDHFGDEMTEIRKEIHDTNNATTC